MTVKFSLASLCLRKSILALHLAEEFRAKNVNSKIFWQEISFSFAQEYSTTITFREEWLDERLKFNDFNGKSLSCLYATSSCSQVIWLLAHNSLGEEPGVFQKIL